jgi:hypothetical protein
MLISFQLDKGHADHTHGMTRAPVVLLHAQTKKNNFVLTLLFGPDQDSYSGSGFGFAFRALGQELFPAPSCGKALCWDFQDGFA